MNDQRLPIATLLLIAANIGAAFLLIWHPVYVQQYGFDPANPSVKTAITSLFLHQNVLHLLGNMVFLAAVGPAVEVRAGVGRYLVVYLLGGFAGVAVHWFFAQRAGNTAPLIGASGCVSACIAYYALRYYHQRVHVAPSLSVPVYAIIAVWLCLQIAGAFVAIGSVQPGTAYWAHVGGFAMGLILSITFSAPQEAHREKTKEMMTAVQERSPAAKLAAAELVLRKNPNEIEALRDKAGALEMLNEPEKEAQVLIRLLDLLPESEQKATLVRLSKMNRFELIPSLRRTLIAERLKTTEPDLARLLLMSVIRVMTDGQRPDALYALACLDHDEYPENAGIWLKDLMTTYPLHPAADLARARGWAQ